MSSRLSAAIRTGLVLKGVNQSHLADEIGVSCNTVSRWIKDTHLPDKESLSELVRFFDWSQDKMALLVEDWFENERSDKIYRVSGAEFVSSRYGGDYTAFLNDLLALDKATIIGVAHEHLGTAEQWAPIFQQSPYTWKLLVSHGEIVGYWQFICLKGEYFSQVFSGEIIDSEITMEMLDFPVIPGDYKGYFCVVATRPQDRDTTAISVLLRSLEKVLSDFTNSGLFFSQFCATAFSFEGKRMCELMGMNFRGRHPRANGSEVSDIYVIEGREIEQSYWGRNGLIRKTYRDHFG